MVSDTEEFFECIDDVTSGYDPVNDKIVLIYEDFRSSPAVGRLQMYGVVGTVDDMSVTWGTRVIINVTNTSGCKMEYEPLSGNFLVLFDDETMVVISVNGDSLDVGSEYPVPINVYRAGMVATGDGRMLVTGISTYVRGFVCSITGLVIVTGGAIDLSVAESDSGGNATSAYDSVNDKYVVGFSDDNSPYNGKLIMLTLSALVITVVSETTFIPGGKAVNVAVGYHPPTGNLLITCSDNELGWLSRAIVGIISGTSIALSDPVYFSPCTFMGSDSYKIKYNSADGGMYLGYQDYDEFRPVVTRFELSGAIIDSYETEVIQPAPHGDGGGWNVAMALDTTSNRVIMFHKDESSSYQGLYWVVKWIPPVFWTEFKDQRELA